MGAPRRGPLRLCRRNQLEAHRKAADYSIAKTRVNIAAIVFDAAILLVLTFGGGCRRSTIWPPRFSEGIARGVVFVAILVVIMSVIELPFTCTGPSASRSRFGFTR